MLANSLPLAPLLKLPHIKSSYLAIKSLVNSRLKWHKGGHGSSTAGNRAGLIQLHLRNAEQRGRAALGVVTR